jgi:quinoprotein glucose dehydrogenase
LPTDLNFTIGTPNNGGPVVTASGLTFITAAMDGLIRAIDSRMGKTVWSASIPAGGQANPMMYGYEGREYLLITAGGPSLYGNAPPDYVIAYTLPES